MPDEKLTHWLVLGPFVWGKGATRAEALKNCRANGDHRGTYRIFRVDPTARVTGMGDLDFAAGCRPELVEQRKRGKLVPLPVADATPTDGGPHG